MHQEKTQLPFLLHFHQLCGRFQVHDYDYMAFRKKINGDIAQLTHPVYFYWPGFSGSEFYVDEALKEEIVIHTNMGLLREGDSLHVDSVYVTDIGHYQVIDEYVVDVDTIAVPYTLGSLIGTQVVCNQDGLTQDDFSDVTLKPLIRALAVHSRDADRAEDALEKIGESAIPSLVKVLEGDKQRKFFSQGEEYWNDGSERKLKAEMTAAKILERLGWKPETDKRDWAFMRNVLMQNRKIPSIMLRLHEKKKIERQKRDEWILKQLKKEKK